MLVTVRFQSYVKFLDQFFKDGRVFLEIHFLEFI